MDANFRLKNRLRAGDKDDPTLGDGLAYVADHNMYEEHIKGYVDQEEVSYSHRSLCITLTIFLRSVLVSGSQR
jgi:hypothetical protein